MAEDGYKSLQHPGSPAKYQNNLDYTWKVSDGPSHTLKIEFGFIDLEASAGCTNDFIAIYDGPSTRYPLLGRLVIFLFKIS